ncbi:MAG: hypothetical protein JWN44_1156 [Myxococcales bacterium]|nr:hypothetical protein [Myxococcales bacterium]
MRAWAALLTTIVIAALSATAARAESATCDVPVIKASPGDPQKGLQLDPSLERLKPYLTKAPFTSWHEFKMMDANHVQVPANGSATFALPNGRQATLTFFGHATGSDEHRLRLKLVVEHPEKHHKVLDTTFVLDEGGVMLHVGQQKETGVWIVAVSCKTHD